MNRETVVTAVLSGAAALLLIGAAAGVILKDRSAPVISLEGKNTLTYTEGDSYEELLKGMKAEDNKDGDVTESLRVSNIYVTSKDRAMVVYVAKDEANNIGKLKREVRYQEAIPETEALGNGEEAPGEDTVTESNSKGTDQTATETTTQKPAETEAQTQDTQNTQDTQGQDTEEQNGPRIIMLQNEATLKVGETFNIYRYIERAIDENGNDISRSMHMDGTYDMTKAGIYELKLYVINGAGVRSQSETFTLTVTE